MHLVEIVTMTGERELPALRVVTAEEENILYRVIHFRLQLLQECAGCF